jgi:hypothetical protein
MDTDFDCVLFPFIWLNFLILTVYCSVCPICTHWFWLLIFEMGLTASVAGRQGMLTPPWHLIPPLVYSDVRVCPILKFVFFYRTYEIDDCSLHVTSNMLNATFFYVNIRDEYVDMPVVNKFHQLHVGNIWSCWTNFQHPILLHFFLHVNRIILHVDIFMLHVDIIIFYADII